MFGYGILCEDDSDSEDDEQCSNSLPVQPPADKVDVHTKPKTIVSESVVDGDHDQQEDETSTTKNSNTMTVYTAPYTQIKKNVFIMHGKEETRMSGEKIVIYNNSKVSLFWGKCFLCGCVGHSQRYCPLKYCSKCGTYGHSMVTCMDDKEDLNLRTNRMGAGGGIHPSMTSQNWRKNNRQIYKRAGTTTQK